MNELDYRVNRKKYYIRYFIMMFLVLIICYSAFIITGKTFVAKNDSVLQHYPNLFKVRDFYFENICNLIHFRNINQMDYNTFFGADIIQTYNYYGYGNPISLILLLFSDGMMPYAYQLIYIICIILGGISFSEYCFYHKKSEKYVLIATFLFVTSPFLMMDLDQLCFAYLFYQIPLMFLGFDMLLDKKKSYFMILPVWLMALSGVYFFCMVTVEIAIYGCYRVIEKKWETGFKGIAMEAIEKVIQTIKVYLIAIGLAAPVFFPVAYGTLFSGRVSGGKKNFNLFFDLKTYIKNALCMFVYVPYHHVTLNFAIVALIVLLFIKTKDKKNKIIVSLLLIASQLSIVGSLFNGFYQTNQRWFFVFYLYIAFLSINIMEKCIKKEKTIRILCIIAVVQPLFSSFIYEGYNVSTLKKYKNTHIDEVVTSDNNVEFEGDRDEHGYFYKSMRTPWIYNSLLSSNTDKAMKSFDNSKYRDVNEIYGLDMRPDLQALFNIDYAYSMDGINNTSYNMENVSSELSRNKYNTRFGFCYDSVVSESDIEEKTGIEKGMLTLENGIVDDFESELLDKYSKKELNPEPNNISFKKNELEDGKIHLSFDTVINSQIYLYIATEKLTFGKTPLSVEIYANDKCVNNTDIVSLDNEYSVEREKICCNAGYYDEITDLEIKFTVPQKDIDIELLSVDMSNYSDYVNRLNEISLSDVKWRDNCIEGTIDSPNDKMLSISIPINPGWTAYIDGEKTEIHKLNYMFMGLEIPKGEHKVMLKYETPGLILGCFVLIISIILMIINVILLLYKRKIRINEKK